MLQLKLRPCVRVLHGVLSPRDLYQRVCLSGAGHPSFHRGGAAKTAGGQCAGTRLRMKLESVSEVPEAQWRDLTRLRCKCHCCAHGRPPPCTNGGRPHLQLSYFSASRAPPCAGAHPPLSRPSHGSKRLRRLIFHAVCAVKVLMVTLQLTCFLFP